MKTVLRSLFKNGCINKTYCLLHGLHFIAYCEAKLQKLAEDVEIKRAFIDHGSDLIQEVDPNLFTVVDNTLNKKYFFEMPDEHKKNFSLILGKMFFVGVEEGSHK